MTTVTRQSSQPTPTGREVSRQSMMLGALYAVILANGVQVAAGLAGLDVSPPEALLPFIVATAVLGIAFCVISMIGMGPHKVFLEDGLVIAPLALVGFAFELTFIRLAVPALRGRP